MRRVIIAFATGLLGVLFILWWNYDSDRSLSELVEQKGKMLAYYNSPDRNADDALMDCVIDENSVVVLGSSELGSYFGDGYPPYLFNNGNSDFNMVLVGQGYMQSLAHTLSAGALKNNIKNNKLVLIISPQWFVDPNTTPEAFSSIFIEEYYEEFLNNPDIDMATKTQVAGRVISLLSSSTAKQEKATRLWNQVSGGGADLLGKIDNKVDDYIRDFKKNKDIIDMINEHAAEPYNEEMVLAENLDFESLLKKAEQDGQAACSGNDYGIENAYYDEYIRDQYADLKGSSSTASFDVSDEYQDFRTFLDVCRQLGLETMVVSVPVHGQWYDYCGFPAESRTRYYQTIRDICVEYQVELADFSDKEYEKFFLKDIMHLGWKGWLYVDQAVYGFYKK